MTDMNRKPRTAANNHCEHCGQRLPLDPTNKQAIVAMYLKGYTQQRIAELFDVSQSYVSKTIRGHDS